MVHPVESALPSRAARIQQGGDEVQHSRITFYKAMKHDEGVFMKYRFKVAYLSLLLLIGLSVISYGGVEEGQAKAVISINTFEFKPVLDGAEVIHDFVIQNTGTATLNIEKIETG